jgi:hypothetical protein
MSKELDEKRKHTENKFMKSVADIMTELPKSTEPEHVQKLIDNIVNCHREDKETQVEYYLTKLEERKRKREQKRTQERAQNQ